jgi:arginyl-tRNA--protein-N-Asp/Glu arginylyltransferase
MREKRAHSKVIFRRCFQILKKRTLNGSMQPSSNSMRCLHRDVKIEREEVEAALNPEVV